MLKELSKYLKTQDIEVYNAEFSIYQMFHNERSEKEIKDVLESIFIKFGLYICKCMLYDIGNHYTISDEHFISVMNEIIFIIEKENNKEHIQYVPFKTGVINKYIKLLENKLKEK